VAERERWRQLRVLIDRGTLAEQAYVTVVFRSVDGRVRLDKRLMSLMVELSPEASSREAVAAALHAAWERLTAESWPSGLP